MNAVYLDAEKIFPSKIVCIGRNYLDHIAELSNEVPKAPVIFLKPNSSIAHQLLGDDPDGIHYEGELSFLLHAGRPYAVGFGLDLTKRALQTELKAKGLPWERAKAFDGAALFSPFVRFEGPLDQLGLELSINGRLAQKGGVEHMLHKPHHLLDEIQSFMTLQDNDVLMTGTPKGVGPVCPGDHFVGKVFNDRALLIEAQWTAVGQ